MHMQTCLKKMDGTPMGSPISVALTELVMQSIEKQIFSSSPFVIQVWKRYVDDIFAIFLADE